jgi:hypothetical protein
MWRQIKVDLAWEAAKNHPFASRGDEATEGVNLPKMQLLIALCYHLQRINGDSPFFSNFPRRRKPVGCPHTTVYCWLKSLTNPDGEFQVLRKVKTGSLEERTANEYLYLSLTEAHRESESSRADLVPNENTRSSCKLRFVRRLCLAADNAHKPSSVRPPTRSHDSRYRRAFLKSRFRTSRPQPRPWCEGRWSSYAVAALSPTAQVHATYGIARMKLDRVRRRTIVEGDFDNAETRSFQLLPLVFPRTVFSGDSSQPLESRGESGESIRARPRY